MGRLVFFFFFWELVERDRNERVAIHVSEVPIDRLQHPAPSTPLSRNYIVRSQSSGTQPRETLRPAADACALYNRN